MFKRAKLFSLAGIIITSAVIGLFSFPKTAYADRYVVQDGGEILVTWTDDGQTQTSGTCSSSTQSYNRFSSTDNISVIYPGIPNGSIVFTCTIQRDGMNIDKVIYFENTTLDKLLTETTIKGKYAEYQQSCTQEKDGKAIGCEPLSPAITIDALSAPGIENNLDAKNNDPSTCQIKGIGWFVCPILSFLGGLADGVYYILDTVFLRLPPVNMDLNDTANGTYISWKIMRDVANIVFVIAFLIIVFSQITNIGISNYGIKRLVPKLIIAAILVNTSFFICAVAVDVSNVLGTSLKSLLDGASKGILQPETETAFNSGGFWQGMITGVLVISFVGAAALAGFATLAMAGGALLFIVPIVVTVLITMIVRQALVILLIVLSPLAFVALLLPNTEGYYKKWLELFKAMLLIYPIIALVFGASALASTVLMAAAKDAGNLQALHQVAAGLVRVLPLVMIPTLMKISSGVFGRVTGMVNDKQKGWFDAKRNAMSERGQIQRANRIAGIGRWVRDNPRRRRGLAALTAYGSNNRTLRRKDELNKAQSDMERAYLGDGKNVNARNAAENAKISLQNAQLNAESVRLNALSADFLAETETAKRQKKTVEDMATARGLQALAGSIQGRDTLEHEKNAELVKEIAENRTSQISTESANHALEAGAKLSSINKDAAHTEAEAHALEGVNRSASGQAALTRLEEAKTNKKSADDIAAATGLAGVNNSVSGQAALAGAENAKNTKQIESDNSQAIGIAGADRNLKMRATTSSEELSNIQNQDKQIYEEVIAKPDLAAARGISPEAVADAIEARETAAVTREATARAQGVSADTLSQRVIDNEDLAAEMGGVDPNGALAAQTRAANALSQSHNEAVNNYLSLFRTKRVTGTQSMEDLPDSNGAQMEANAVNVAKYGADEDIIALLNYAGGLDASIPEQKARKVAILQQYADNVGNRNPPAIGQRDFELIRNGSWSGDVNSSWRERTRTGSFSGSKAATMSQALLKSQHEALSTGAPLTDAEREGLKKYADSIIEYRNDKLIKQPEAKITDEMDRIVKLYYPDWEADKREPSGI